MLNIQYTKIKPTHGYRDPSQPPTSSCEKFRLTEGNSLTSENEYEYIILEVTEEKNFQQVLPCVKGKILVILLTTQVEEIKRSVVDCSYKTTFRIITSSQCQNKWVFQCLK